MCGTSTQSVKMSRRATSSLRQLSSGNTVHGLNAVSLVGQVRETTVALDQTQTLKKILPET